MAFLNAMRSWILALALLACATACPTGGDGNRTPDPNAPQSLYQRIGGVERLRVVVDDFATNLAADPRISARFVDTDFTEFKRHWLEQLCVLCGGPCEYRGRPMAEVHRGRRITDADFSALVDNLARSLDRFGIEAKLQGELLSKIAAMRGVIVAR